MSIHIHLEKMKVPHHVFFAETGIEPAVQFDVTDQGHRWKIELLGHQKHVLQRGRQPAAHIGTTIHHSPPFGSQQTAHQIEQRGFAHAILPQQPIHFARFQRKREITQDFFSPSVITKRNIFCL